MARTNEFTECLVDWVDGRLRQNRFSNLWLGGGAGAHGGSSYRPIDGQLTQRHVCYDTSETASPCVPSGSSSLVDNLRRIRYWQEPATWFGVETTPGLQVYIKPGLWYPSTTEYCAFAGGNSPTFTLPGALDRIDTVYIDPSGILHIQRGTPAISPTITLPPIASGIPLWAVYLPPTASGIYFQVCSGYYAGQGYIERDLRPFLNLGGGGAVASGVLPASNRGAILRGGVADWETYNVGAANEVLTNDGTDVIWSTGAIDLTAGKTLIVSVNLTLAGIDGKSLTIEENSILNQDLTTDASVTFADVFVPDGGTFGISGNELLAVNAAGNFTFSGVTSIVVSDGAWVGADADCAWLFNSTSGYVTTQDTTGVGTTAPEGMLDVAYGGYIGKMTLLLGADLNAITRTNNTNKRTIMGSYHYINAEQPVAMMYAFSSSILNRLDIGGGHIYCNAATQVSIYTAANTTTTTGTNRFSVSSTGAITVTGPSFTVPAAWNLIVPDNVANALSLIDNGAADVYLQIVTTTGSEEVIFNAGGDDIDFTIQATGVADALQVQGSDGQITLGILTAGFVKSDAGGVLSVVTEVALVDLASYVQGSIVRGGAADWEALAHPGTAYHLQTDANDIVWAQNIIMANGAWIGIGVANEAIIFDAAGDICVMGAKFGINTLIPAGILHIEDDGSGVHLTRGTLDMGWFGANNGPGYFGCESNDDLYIRTNATTRITVLAGGNVGIGLAPVYQLDVKDDTAGGYAAKFFNDGDNINRHGIIIQAGADNGAAAGTTTYIYAMDGDGNGTGAIRTVDGVFGLADLSDESRKINIKDTKLNGLDIINGLRVRDYNWKANPKGPVMTSFVAQEAQKVFPAMVGEDNNGLLMTSRAMLIPILTKAIQELNTKLAALGG